MRGLAIILFFMFQIPLYANENTGHLSGCVIDKQSASPLIGATIYVRELSAGTITDLFGNYNLNVKPGKYLVEVSYVGYATQIFIADIKVQERTNFKIELSTSPIQLEDIVITPNIGNNQINTLSRVDIGLRPVNTSQDILRMIPGLVIAQHAGGGKAEQIFLRGFDIDHGTDINLTVDGLPVNMASHAHGQGYSDLHFLIPETIRDVDFEKGPYNSSKGDFATAGYASFNTFSMLDENMIKLEGGQFGMFRNVNLLKLIERSNSKKTEQLYAATELYRTDGFFESSQNFKRMNGMLRYYNRRDDKRLFSVTASGFSSDWNSSGQIPERAVTSGMISRFGSIDNAEGGKTSRYNINTSLTHNFSKFVLQQRAYVSLYDFNLLSNFTFYLNDPINGDRIRQLESRQIFGYSANLDHQSMIHQTNISSTYGAGIRYDRIEDSQLAHVKDFNHVLDFISRGDVRQSNTFVYTDQLLNFSSGLSIKASLRYDLFHFQYADKLINSNSVAHKGMISPKLGLEYDVTSNSRLFLRAGYGFHSNDARSSLLGQGKKLIPKAFGVDVGTEWKPIPQMLVHTSLWFLGLEQELVYVGDEGIVEPSGATSRKGIDLSVRYQLSPAFFADVDLNLTHARLKYGESGHNYIPLAPSFTSIGGVQYKTKKVSASLRYRFLGDRAANEDNSLTADGYLLLDGLIHYKIKRFSVSFSIENILNKEWKEAQFETESRLLQESEPVTEIHFTPGTPRFFKAGVQINF